MIADVIIPAYNESERLAETLTALKGQTWVNKIILIDDGSTDDTKGIALEFTDAVYSHEVNKGKAEAVFTGLSKLTGEWVILLDADLGGTATEAEKLLIPLENKLVDMSIAMLPNLKKKGFGLVKNRAKNIVLKQTNVHLHSPLSGQRAFHHSWVPYILSGKGVGYGLEIYLNLLFLKHGAIIKEVNTEMAHRETGKNLKGFYHRAKQWLEMELTIWNYS